MGGSRASVGRQTNFSTFLIISSQHDDYFLDDIIKQERRKERTLCFEYFLFLFQEKYWINIYKHLKNKFERTRETKEQKQMISIIMG